MYLGSYSSQRSTKNQLVFPSKFKELTGTKLFIANWFERSLIVLPYKSAQETINNMLHGGEDLIPEARDLERFLYGSAIAVDLDDKNRFVLEKPLVEYAQIKAQGLFIGVGDRIELWDKDTYAQYGKILEVKIRKTALDLYNSHIQKERKNT